MTSTFVDLRLSIKVLISRFGLYMLIFDVDLCALIL